ncbi:hypothetical protein OUZ56_026069 [Daphnia magna]|uniref:Uncharacterized protein n=1 Tax=Daphnia magna TaxID=35525 RepID=A0ABQ9ZKP6_9CRUS|nr:hypothetical protein OUZ56_026069 [Daphnia magna]
MANRFTPELPRSMEMIEIEGSIDQFSLIEAIELITADDVNLCNFTCCSLQTCSSIQFILDSRHST